MVGVIVVINLYMYFEMQNEKLMKFVFFSFKRDWSFVLVFLFFVFTVPHVERERTCEVRSRFHATVWNGLMTSLQEAKFYYFKYHKPCLKLVLMCNEYNWGEPEYSSVITMEVNIKSYERI